MITAFYAALLALMFLALTWYVILGRISHKISLGDAGNDNMQKRIRIHANFAEFVPFALLLMWFSEMQNAPIWSIHVGGILLIVGRICHIWGILHKHVPNVQRVLGNALTQLVILAAALWCVWIFIVRMMIVS